MLTKADFLSAAKNCTNKTEEIKVLLEGFSEVFVAEEQIPLNMQDHDLESVGDKIIEPNTKYKNYYKKVFNPKQIVSPFTASQIIDDLSSRIWIYMDQNDRIQGPFTSIEMDNWYNREYLPMDLLIGLNDREKCVKLSDFISSTYPFEKNPDLYHTKKWRGSHAQGLMTPQPGRPGKFSFPA